MQYTILGKTGLKVSRLGFGAMRLPMRDGKVNRDLSTPLFRRAYELGVTYFDTAVGYCESDSQPALGEALQGIRENEPRMRALGYNTWLYRYIAFIIAGLFAGVAGIFFAPFNGIMSPVHVGVETSAYVMLMVVLGSPSVIFGPVLGAAVVVALEQTTIIYQPYRWPLIFGAVFVLSVMFLRQGLSVYLIKLWRKIVRGSSVS